MDSLLLTAQQVASLLGVGVSTLWSWHSAGRIPLPVRIGGKTTRWRVSEIEAWVQAGCPGRDRWLTMCKNSGSLSET
ncbi:MAG: helix-turn-helix domain-containing protein [Planctomycetota bacterium]